MEINLETNEILKVIVDGACGFNVRGERNEEGTMVLNTKVQIDIDMCKCGHHTNDHSYNPDFSTNLRCDICDCQEFRIVEAHE